MDTQKLNELQLTLLRLFQRDMSEEEILSLKRVLVRHYKRLLDEELSRVMEIKQYTDKDFEQMLNNPNT
ncbi:MAG: hypothetical protein JJT94_12255 [Bernardetiaceae bacterium]|nr:hypothetical protein [Bernardetiaceae bacterium]